MIIPDENVHLTRRQTEVLRHTSQGLIAKQIARRLRISVRTVEGHLRAMRELTGTRNMAELTVWALSTGALGAAEPAKKHTA